MTERSDRDLVSGVLDRFDLAFAAGDADAFADCFAEDAHLYLLHREATDGLRRDADGRWRITLLMNSHSHPMEPIE